MNNKIKYYLLVLFLLINCKLYSQNEYSEINTPSDERTIAFSVINGSTVNIWRTTGSGCLNNYSRKIDVSSGETINFKNAVGLNRNQVSDKGLFYDGSPAFPVCYSDSAFYNWGVIVSNRFNNGKDFDNDIYEIKYSNAKNEWEIGRRIDEINSEYWDDTPAISPNGKVIIFASNRNSPNRRGTDLFISHRLADGKWEIPAEIKKISAMNSNEVSPFFGSDGYLYFASDTTGDYDIYRIKLNVNCEPDGKIEELPIDLFPGVNKKSTNEVSPCFSPGGQFFLFSSDRKDNSTNFDFYYIKANAIHGFNDDISFNLQCWELSDTLDFYKEIEKRQKKSCISSLDITDVNKTFQQKTENNGNVNFTLSRYNGKFPHQDFYNRNAKINVKGECCKAEREFSFVFNSFCNNKQNADLELYCASKPLTKFPFIIDSIPFFVTSYWCPSTNKYKNKDTCGCTSIFNVENKCEVTPTEQKVTFNYECESNEVYTFANKYNPVIKPSYNVYRTSGSCIDISEMNNIKNHVAGYDWSDKVDIQIDGLYKQMERALDNIYINYAIDKGKKLNVNVFGWTDLRALDNSCIYTGNDIDLNLSTINLEDSAMLYGKLVKKNYIAEGLIKNGTPFVYRPWLSGNQLLSDLRAYYMAYLLNNLWMQIPKYSLLAGKKQIIVKAIGRGIKSKPGVPMHYNRSGDGLVEIDQGDQQIFETVAGMNPVQKIYFKVANCNCNK
jgi:hypothetical protein